MKNLLLCILCFAGFGLWSQSTDQSVQKESISFLSHNEEAITGLGMAIPAEKFNWKPAEGVRTVGEVLMHTAASNYFILMNLGIKPPANIDMMNMEKMEGKDKILDAVHASFKFVNDNLLSVKDAQLGEMVKFPWAEMSKQAVMFLLVDHTGEHKGQLIAYARSVGVTPPWSK
ncbi:MAG: DinB family protein [Saprospiraceae bacterium]|nr:DinB family protein [Saprospiraceae bacterium]